MKRLVWEVFSVGGFRKEVEGEDGRRFNCLCAPLFSQPRQKQFICGKLCFLQRASWGLPCVASATRVCTPPRRIPGLEGIWGNTGLCSDKQKVVPSTDRHTTQCSSVVPVLMWASHSIFLISTPTLTPPHHPHHPHPTPRPAGWQQVRPGATEEGRRPICIPSWFCLSWVCLSNSRY